MKDIILDTIIDGIKLLPFLFVAFLIIELLEHKYSDKQEKILQKTKKVGPVIGGLLGLFPQCGFSVMATNLYATRIITLGTLISIYLTTSDEMLPILLSHKIKAGFIVKILLIKFVIGVLIGFIIDLIYHKKEQTSYEICEDEKCHCKENLFLGICKHTIKIFTFIIIFTFILNTIMYYYGESYLFNIFMKNNILSILVSGLIGLIPNCASSVILCELFVNKTITFGSLISGLLCGSGIGLMVLFKVNKNIRENIKIVSSLYIIAIIVGFLIDRLF